MFRSDSIFAYRGWWIVTSLFAASAITVGSSHYAFSIFVQPLQDEFGWSRTQINASLSFAALGSLTAPLWGKLIDKFGSKYVLAVCLAMFGLSFLLRPFMDKLWHWYALSALQFIGFSGAAPLPAGKLVGVWFQKMRGRLMGFTMMGNNFGGLVLPPMVGAIVIVASWEAAYTCLGLITVCIVILGLIAIKESPSGSAKSRFTKNMQSQDITGLSLNEALHKKSFYLINASILLGTFTYGAALPQIFSHLTNEGVSTTTASQAVAVLALFGMVGKIGFGYLSEQITARYSLMICLGGQAIFLVTILGSENSVVMWASVVFFGLCMGAFGALMQLIVQEGFGIKSFGSIMGSINLASVIPLALGPIIAGISFDRTGSYQSAFIAVAIMFLIAIILLWYAGAPSFRFGSRSVE